MPGRQSSIRWRARLRRLILLLLFPLFLGGCPTVYIRMGQLPSTDVLEKSLHVGQSTRQDVLAALGRPYATGRWMLPTDSQPRTLWTYYYENGTLEDARRFVLLVYFDQDRFDGYVWFSSLPK